MQANTIQATKQVDGLTTERMWLEWLMAIWEKNQKKPNWIAIKRQWPDEYQAILKDVGTWQDVDMKLEALRRIRQENLVEKQRAEFHSLDLGRRSKYYTLEDYLLGLEKMMNFLNIDRIPSQSELYKYANQLHIPSATAYSRKLLTRDCWPSFLTRYHDAHPEDRQEVLNQIELELRERKVEKTKKKELSMKPGVKAHTEEECLEMLCQVQQYLNIDTVPSASQITACQKELNLPHEKTFRNILGPKARWWELLAQYKERKKINDFLSTYSELKDGTLNVDALVKRALEVATEAEKLRWKTLTEKVQMATRRNPATCTVYLDGKDYEITIKPLG